jgi:hypothetical protein
MRSLHKFVITAGLLCHLFPVAPLVASQARAEQSAQIPAVSVEQPTPTPTPAETPEQNPAPSKDRVGNCHLTITSPPSTQQAAKATGEPQPHKSAPAAAATEPKKVKLPISEELPVIIDADECDKAGDVYTLTRNVEIRFNGYDFRGDMVTYDAKSGDVTAKGNAHQRHRRCLQYPFANRKVL